VGGKRIAELLPVWSVALGWALIDQIVKVWALGALRASEREIIPSVLWLNLTRNPGAAFGLFPHGQVFFILVAVFLMGVGVWAPLVMGGRRWDTGRLGLGLLVGGGLGNLIDRVFRGGEVVDFIDFRFWPVFNVADMGIVTGTVLVFIYLAGSILRPGEDGPA
jgi:signal peptidase II